MNEPITKQDLYIDFDSTLVMSDKAFATMYNEIYKDDPDFVPADWKKHWDWTYSRICPLLHKYYEDAHLATREYYNSETLFEHLEFFPDAKETVEKLAAKYNLIICTSAFPKNAARKVLWIEEHLPIVDEIIILINNSGKGFGKARVPMMEPDAIFIDDHPVNLRSTKAANKYLFKSHETEYSQDWDGPILTTWKQVEETLL
jgi:5'(3')-deoxyribonucleotidase